MMDKTPLVSVCLLNWNRRETVLENLSSILRQTYPQVEIIVTDNGSVDGSAEAITGNFPGVKLIALKNNIGIAGRNEAIKAARGEIIVTLDDDVFFHTDKEIERIVEYLQSRSDVHVGIMKILDQDGRLLEMNWYHPRKWEMYADTEFRTDYIPEGASFFRREVFLKAGHYPESFFIGQEGPDLAYRLINNGFNIFYVPGIRVIHRCETSGKTKKRFVYNNIVNHFRLAVRNFPSVRAFRYMVYRMITMLLYSIQQKNLYWYLLGIKDAFPCAGKELKNRRPMSREALHKLKEIRKMKPGPLVKLYYQMRRQRIRNKKYRIFST